MEKNILKLFDEHILRESTLLFHMKPENIQLISDVENFVYSNGIDEPPCILRITHSSHRTREEILGELEWMGYLSNNGVSVPQSILSVNGMLVEVIGEGQSYFLVTAFQKIPGKTIIDANECTPGIYQQWGQILGKMHALAKHFNPSQPVYKRSEWIMEDVVCNAEKYIPAQLVILEKYKNLIHQLGALQKDENSYGLIHADLSDVNFFVHDHKITVFDFDDCTYHWFVHDIAVILYDCLDWLPHESLNQDEFLHYFWGNFYQGYNTENSLDPFWIEQLPKFLKLREMNQYVFFHKKWDMDDLSENRRIYLEKLRNNILSNNSYLNFSSIN